MSNSAFTVTGTSQNITFPITVPQGGSGVASFNPYEILIGGTTSIGPIQQVSSLGTPGQVLTSQGPGMPPNWTTISTTGAVVNRVSTYSYSTATYNNPNLPSGGLYSVPINTDGVQILSQTITPTNASHVLVIEAYADCSVLLGNLPICAAIFQDSTVNALYAQEFVSINNSLRFNCFMRLIITAGTISSTTFKVRIGSPSGAEPFFFINHDMTGTFFGGLTTQGPWIQITEYTS